MIHYDLTTSHWVGEESKHEEYAFTSLLSVDLDGEITYGYDGSFDTEDFSVAERHALADTMIKRWTDWKESQK